jgi:Zn-dependent peptidase ImmA (M78 family)
MAERIKALVERELLVWSRKTAHLSVEAAAQAAHVSIEKIEAWEAGSDGPSIPELKKLANAYKRPLSVFFLAKPPADFGALKDFRRLQGVGAQEYSRELAFEVRSAQERRQVAVELNSELGEELPLWDIRATLQDDPEAVAAKLREHLSIATEQQSRWRDPSKAFRAWREAIEGKGVLVSVLGGAHHGVPLTEVRGFAIAERPLPMIVVNGRDRTNGRIFTLMHELAHIVAGVSAIENEIEPGAHLPAPDRVIETFCNRVAAATLMPAASLRAERLTARKGSRSTWDDLEIDFLAQRYSVSREAMLVRLADLGLASPEFAQARRRRYATEYEVLEDEVGGGFVPPARQTVAFLGGGFARLVLQAYHDRVVTLSTASGYLGTQAKNLAKIEAIAFGAVGSR